MRVKPILRRLLSVFLAEVLFLLLPVDSTARETTAYSPYFGLLHAHTEISGAEGSVENAFAQASQVDGLDFFAVTDHSHSFDNANSGAVCTDGTTISKDWAAGKAAAAAVTGEAFVGIFGYEMAFRDSDGYGHISTFHTPGWQSRNQAGFDTLTAYYDALATVPGSVSQFNHPSFENGCFENFGHRTDACDDAISLLEVNSESDSVSCDFYIRALDLGWHLAPTASQNNYHGDFGTESDVRTVLLAESLTEESLYDAMKNRRAYATEDKDLVIDYTLNGACLGSVLPFQEEIAITAVVTDDTDSGAGTLEVLTNGGTVLFSREVSASSDTVSFSMPGTSGYYFLRITQSDGDIAVTAPIWVEETATPPPSEPEESTPETSEPEESTPETTLPEDSGPDMDDLDVGFFFGLLHGHTALSDGKGTVEEAFAAASAAENMDFYAVTDHSNSFDNADSGVIDADGTAISQEWSRGKTAAENAATDDFLALFGYEMTWTDDRNLGHISTFNTPGWQTRNQDGFDELEPYYKALTTVPGSVSQFNHPGPDLGEFENFGHYSAKYDAAVSLLEIGEGAVFDAYDSYIKALDAGWHVAPTVSQNDHEGTFGTSGSARTVVLAETLTEESLYEAMSQRRAYATQDADLRLYYTLDDTLMGSIIRSSEQHTIRLLLDDPTDSGSSAVEIITDGGRVSDTLPVPENGVLEYTVSGGGSYYFLRITQADGDIAVTAPFWTESYENVGIVSFVSGTEVPVPGQELNLTLTLFNEEAEDFLLTSLSVIANGKTVSHTDTPGTVPAAGTIAITVPYSQEEDGIVTIQAAVTGSVGGVSRSLETALTLRFRAKEMVKGILVDLGHSSHRETDFDNLKLLADDANMAVTCFTGDLPEEGSILILPPPETPYDVDFIQQVKIFCARGGSLVICGASHRDNPRAAESCNLLLQTLGSSISLRQDTALDNVHNGGKSHQLYPTKFNTATFWCKELSSGQFYAHISGCTVAPGKGTWLVKGFSTSYSSFTQEEKPVLLAREELSSGNHILAAGSLFVSDDAMPLPKNRWDAPSGNQTIVETLLGITRETFPVTDIAAVRKGRLKTLYHIKGYTTSGTSNNHNTFPDTIYLQDETGGIAIYPFHEPDIPVGTPMIAAGYLKKQDGNLVFYPVDYDFPEERRYRYVPDTLNHSRATDYKTYGGQLLQVEAKAISVTLTEDGQGVSRIILEDAWGDRATVMIEDCIGSGAYGANELASEVKIGRKIRAMGLLHIDSNGIPVLRVRNCEEVVWVPPIPRPGDRQNPYTGDCIGMAVAVGSISASALVLLWKKRKK